MREEEEEEEGRKTHFFSFYFFFLFPKDFVPRRQRNSPEVSPHATTRFEKKKGGKRKVKLFFSLPWQFGKGRDSVYYTTATTKCS